MAKGRGSTVMERLIAARELAEELRLLLGSINLSRQRDELRAPVRAASSAAAMQEQVLKWAIRYVLERPPSRDPVAEDAAKVRDWAAEQLEGFPPMSDERLRALDELLVKWQLKEPPPGDRPNAGPSRP